MNKNVIYEIKDKVAIVTLQKSPYNICSKDFYTEIADTFEELHTLDNINCVILSSALKVFSAGGEFKEIQSLGSLTEDEANKEIVYCTRCMSTIYGCRYPVIAAVNGKAIGAGVALAACCDIVIAGESASFTVPEVAVGFIGASEFLQLLIPARLARYYYFTGKPISAQELKSYGGILDVVPDSELMDKALSIANELCRVSPLALQYAKEALNINDNAELVKKYLNEFQYTMKFSRSEDYKESIQSIIDHRTPVFKGR